MAEALTQDQRTPDWFAARVGKFTASEFKDVVERKSTINKKDADGKAIPIFGADGKPTKENEKEDKAAYTDLICRLAFERMTGRPGKDAFFSMATQHGTDTEPFSLEAYSIEKGCLVQQSGFLLHPKYDFVGCSPDGLVGDVGGVEAKCPKSSVIHMRRLKTGMPPEFKWQCVGAMWVTGRKWWDWVSYNADLHESSGLELGLYIHRIERSEQEIQLLEWSILQANAEVEALIKELRKRVA
ncbi:MAG: YqaJ viral recombinase family protein [Xanthomonadales bacterium]|nr:YqaJ viral recombinase family protein [Xanthomonadales bacterium]